MLSIFKGKDSTVTVDCDLVDLVERPERIEMVDFGVAFCCLAAAFFLLKLAVDGAGDCVPLFCDVDFDRGGLILDWTRRKSS